MEQTDARTALIARLEALNKAMPEHRRIDGEIRSLKAEIHTLNLKLVANDNRFALPDFAKLVEATLMPW